jgi:hypothetical protein
MKPVAYRGHEIDIRREGWEKDADGRDAVEYAVFIDNILRYACVPLPYAPAVFDATIEKAQEIIDEEIKLA